MRRAAFVVSALVAVSGCTTDDPVDDARDVGGETPDVAVGGDVRVGSDAELPDMASPKDTAGNTDMRTDPADTDLAGDMTVDADNSDAGTVDMGGPDTGAPVEAGETCELAPDVTAGGTFSGDTTGAADDYSADATNDGCPSGGASGGDHVYLLAPAVETVYTISVTPTGNFDPFLYVKSDCALSSCIDGTVLNGPGSPEFLGLTVPAGERYFLIVDGELFSEGEYTLEIAGS